MHPNAIIYQSLPALVASIFALSISPPSSLEAESGSKLLFSENDILSVQLRTNGSLVVQDKRTGGKWETIALADGVRVLSLVSAEDGTAGANFSLQDQATGLEVTGALRLQGAEMILSLTADGAMSGPLNFPGPFATTGGEQLILPYNQGISYPVDDPSIEPREFLMFAGGNGLSMPWYGVTDGRHGWMAIVETADDASVAMIRRESRLELAPQWKSQKGSFGYTRLIRFVFLDRGGYVAMAKRYRQFAMDTGLFKTLQDKIKQRPNVDRLVGASLLWFQKDEAGDVSRIYREMKAMGMARVLWHSGTTPDAVSELNEMGALTGVYDIYQDAMNPEHFPRLPGINGRWVTAAWKNDDIILDKDGQHYTSWPVEASNGERIFCGVVCDLRVLRYAEARIPSELKHNPFRARMIDTVTATPWRECHHPAHPMTRTDSKRSRMDLLRYVGDELGLVCGAESGHAEAVPYVDYFDGMMSLATYRVPNSGHKPFEIWDEVPEVVSKFQTGHQYRLPLWELVFHDCVVSYWYWGDFNNKLPALWDRRDLFNALYGTPPVLVFNATTWNEQKERFAKSYATAVPVARATGFREMLSHEWLTEDRSVQRTRFANGVVVTVNFGEKDYENENNHNIPPLGFFIDGMPEG